MIIKFLKFLGYVVLFAFVFLFLVNVLVSLFIENQDPIKIAPTNGEYMNIDNNEIFYQKFATSSEENILLVGGTAAWSGVWEKTILELKDKYNVYAVDLPPFGYSVSKEGYIYSLENQSKLISDFIARKKLRNLTIISHSYGAGPSIEVVFKNQEMISKLVVIDGVIHLNPKAEVGVVKEILSYKMPRVVVTKFLLHFPGFLQSRLESFVYKKENVNDYWHKLYSEPLKVDGTSEKMSQWVFDFLYAPEAGQSNLPENYSKFKVPTLIIWGDKDNLTPLSQGEDLHNLIPNSKMEILSDVGHIPMIDDFEGFIKVLKTNLSK